MKATRIPLLLTLGLTLFCGPLPAAAQDAVGADNCYDVPEYGGINAIPAVTMQIHPSGQGRAFCDGDSCCSVTRDTVVNDEEYPPGEGRQVVVGFWEHQGDYQPKDGENPCDGEPTMKIAYPLDYGAEKCYGWKHWVLCSHGNEDLHPNSAKDFSCDEDGVFHYTQWTTMTCEGSEEVGAEGTRKSAAPTRCCQDMPPTIWSQILSGCGK